MADLQEALQILSPTDWTSVPYSSADSLRDYIDEISRKATLIVNSIPEPPQPDPVETTTLNPTDPSSRITPSTHRIGTSDPDILSLQSQWGKPLKLSAKDNPHRIPLYKLPANDGQGAWFGRRSVHEGLGFSRWKTKQASEIEETLRVNQRKMEKGKTPDYSVRGIGAEKLVEDVPVYGKDGKMVIANVKVFHVSAVFPRPTTPRDFSPLIITCEFEGGLDGLERRDGKRGRCWMVISRPCIHEGISPKDGYIRGQYESVEFIREVPRRPGSRSSSSKKGLGESRSEHGVGRHGDSAETPPAEDSIKGRKRGKTDSAVEEKQNTQAEDANEDDTNPVEWIMVTRSDPGGNIPRWMVEKGTPKSICSDTVKFLNWACRDGEELQEPDGTLHDAQSDEEDESDESISESDESDIRERHGLIANVSYLVNAGLERFAPQAVLNYIPHQIYSPSHSTTPDTKSGDRDTTPAGGKGGKGGKKAPEPDSLRSPDKASLSESSESGFATPPPENGNISAEAISKNKKGKLTSHEKQLVKLAQEKRDSEAKLESIRSEMQSLHLEPSSEVKLDKKAEGKDSARSSEASQKSTTDKDKDKKTEPSSPPSRSSSKTDVETVKMHKAASGLFRTESKLLKHLAKIEKEQLKVAGKIQTKQRKEAEREEKSRSRSEVEGLRREVKELKKEVETLRDEREKWLSLVTSLQDENAKLIDKEGGGAGGESK
ncbi:hypothetical protein PHISCL_08405 [Aspergillus sclerotialis]|uniref:DUF3074 domain-containing protein n=1 Tax=Aspergillus sclerotialis TaxID=2070753 RepID=A0A3A2ZN14_9EURO|nr:hypothetical protein PHISCL_08405 [Aspergillus sclerotialis]